MEANRKFATGLLGFQLREQVRYDDGKTEIGSWMSPTAIHHQLAYVVDVKAAHGRLHHFSLWVDNRDDVLRAADILIENGIFIEAGPSKHNNSQGFYLYSYEPGGNRVEVYSGSFLVTAPDWEPVTWEWSSAVLMLALLSVTFIPQVRSMMTPVGLLESIVSRLGKSR